MAGADLVQENGPEDLDLKRGLFDRIAAAAPEHAVLATSTSGLMPTAIAADLPDAAAARLLVAHPFNPPHLLPLVESSRGSGRRGRPWSPRPSSTAPWARPRGTSAPAWPGAGPTSAGRT
ncbi:3-hydroxyacyl-CoA dehydrogenase NAD-binding domain-containing protein [Pseudonocardia sp. T1-2H]|uniref:3-hydroxyacyl-CoA dehydrogenase NAD-binding domain-containing protein n=1 Tax=Pseudonocardia sp. T1-2H TaxID=3128899 RepID=UPI003101A9F4